MKCITTLLLTLQLGLLAGLAQSNSLPIELVNYQGTLSSNGVPVNTPQDIILRLYDGPSGGTQIGKAITNGAVDVNNGQFKLNVEGRDGWTVDDLSRTNLNLEVALRPSGSGDPFVTLSPRQRLASVPKAAVAEKALTIPASALSSTILETNGVDGQILALGSVTGNQIGSFQVVKSFNGLKDDVILRVEDGLALTTVGNTTTLGFTRGAGCSAIFDDCYWTLFGNVGITAPPPATFLPAGSQNWMGTTDRQELELRVNRWRGLRLEPVPWTNPNNPDPGPISAPNFLGGFYQNYATVGVRGAAIGGGGSLAQPNGVNGYYGVVSGGQDNIVGGTGIPNNNNGYEVIGGGFGNRANVYFASIGAGAQNIVDSQYASIVGGERNIVGTTSDHSTIGGGRVNAVGDNASYTSIGGGEFNSVTANSHHGTIGGGYGNVIDDSASTVGGGAENHARGHKNFIGGGGDNVADGRGATVGGGEGNLAMTPRSTIPGGLQARADSFGQQPYASGAFASPGDAQSSLFVLRTQTTGIASTELFLDGGTANARMNVPNNATWTFHILLVARSDTPSFNSDISAGWEIKGIVQNVNNLVRLCFDVKRLCDILPALVPWPDPSVQAYNDNVNAIYALAINVTGVAGDNIRWAATVRTVEVTNP